MPALFTEIATEPDGAIRGNLALTQGDDIEFVFTIEDDDVAIDLSGGVGLLQVSTRAGDDILSFSTSAATMTLDADGNATCTATEAVMADVAVGTYAWDFSVRKASATTTYLRGTLRIIGEVG